VCSTVSAGKSTLEMADDDAWGGEFGVPGGDREWCFRNGALTVRAFEDFVEGAIGGVVTAASIELARFTAEDAPEGTWSGRLCVELGSGCGLVSGALVKLGARVVATEQPEFLEHLRWNQSLNAPLASNSTTANAQSARCEPLDWTSEASRLQLRAALCQDGADVIVGANCIYACDAVEGFLAGVAAISAPDTHVFVCGIPQPPRNPQDSDGYSMLDTFLIAALLVYDCYLVGTGGNAPLSTSEARPAGDDVSCCRGVTSSRSFADGVAHEHNLPVAALADGVWLLLSTGAAPPDWVKPLFKLPLGTRPPVGAVEPAAGAD